MFIKRCFDFFEEFFEDFFRPTANREVITAVIIAIVLIVIAVALAAVASALQSNPNPEGQKSPGETQRPTNDPSKSIGIVMGRALVKNPMVADYKETGADPLFVDSEGGK